MGLEGIYYTLYDSMCYHYTKSVKGIFSFVFVSLRFCYDSEFWFCYNNILKGFCYIDTDNYFLVLKTNHFMKFKDNQNG